MIFCGIPIMVRRIAFLVMFSFSLFMPFQLFGAGLNSENMTPALDHHSSILWETARVIPKNSTLYGYTFSYLLHPVEFGDGRDNRLPVSDHLQVNHLGVSYGLFSSVQLGASLPIALYSSPNTQGYLKSVSGDGRKFFFFGDPMIRAKFSLFPNKRYGFGAGLLGEFTLPIGSTEAMLSDDAFRSHVHLLLQYGFENNTEYFFNAGAGIISGEDRVIATNPVTDERVVVLKKDKMLFLQTGVRYWLIGDVRRAGSLQFEAGLRGEFSDFKVTLQEAGSPVEWSAGALYFLTNFLSLHGAYGTGLGSGATAPLSRLIAGARYITGARANTALDDNVAVSGVSSEAYTDEELDLIFQEAQAEPSPRSRAGLETLLRLKTQYGVLDIGSVNFEFDRSDLTAKAKETVRRLYDELVRIEPKSIKIDGHTDSVGTYEYNLALSKRRAESVKNELVRMGLPAAVIKTEGFSFKYPMASNATAEGRASNRRIEVSVDGLSFRKKEYSREEIELFRRWIYPGGEAAKFNMNRPDLAE